MAPSQHRGDGGETGLGSGQRVRKDDLRIECVGSIDELSSFLGLAAAALGGQEAEAAAIVACLARLQRDLYRLGAELAEWHGGGGVAIGAEEVARLDGDIEASDAGLPKLRNFILPGGGEAAARLHVARAVCRRAERQVVHLAAVAPVGAHVIPYLNRLSLVLFSLARKAAHLLGTGDETV
jgi:cob(I)alamin adenosyltransferase